MTATTSTILTVLLQLILTANNGIAWTNPRFRLVLPSLERMSELADLVGLTVCPGLHAVLHASAPPSIEWFLSLSSEVPEKSWAVYAIVLLKPNCRSKLYVGSCTNGTRGVVARFYDYDVGTHLPRYVKKALDNGYTIDRKVLLAHCSLPSAVKVPLYRVLIVALEAAFACHFWAMFHRDHDYGFNHLCPWPLDSFTYDGLCSHNPLKEAIASDLELSEDELQKIADDTHAKNIEYGRVYHKRQREEATPEFKAMQARANKKARPKTEEHRRAARAAKTFHCAPCDYAAGNNGHLKAHKKSKRHIERIAELERHQHETTSTNLDQEQHEAASTSLDQEQHEATSTNLDQEQQKATSTNLDQEQQHRTNLTADTNASEGEMKKAVFTVMFYEMPVKHNVLTLHSSANEGEKGDVTVFFGLSGTGKTTLSADPKRKLIGDDEHCWSENGVFNIEGGCYAKCIGLSAEKEPDIFNAIKFGSVLENVVFDPETREVDYDDSTLTENTRCAYPIEYIHNAKIPCTTDNHPTNIILLTCDARGVLPPISKLDTNQVMFHFISGYTSKMAGTEDGVTEPQATFSSCFAQPFLALHPMRYAKMLADKIAHHSTNAWLLNTGWVGAGATTGGKRCPLKYTRAILDAIHSGELAKVEYETYPVFNLNVPKTCPNVPDELLNPQKSWTGTADFEGEVKKLGALFKENFEKYSDEATEEVIKAGPQV